MAFCPQKIGGGILTCELCGRESHVRDKNGTEVCYSCQDKVPDDEEDE